VEIHKYFGGNIGHPEDPGVPQTQVEIYIQDNNGKTFYVGSVAEGIAHLLSNEGYRLSITEFPDGKGFGPQNIGFGLIVKRHGDNLETYLRAPGASTIQLPNKVVLTESLRPGSALDVLIEEIEDEDLAERLITLKSGGKNPPITRSPIWGETDLPVYSLEEIKKAYEYMMANDLDFSDLPTVLQELRDKGDS